jgi:site-specific DNA-adenine methylase
MDEAFPHRQPGEFAFGQTYAIKVEKGEPKLGDLVEVAPIALNWFADDDGFVHLTWMHPRVVSVGTDDPAEVATWERVTELILASGQDAPSVTLQDGRLKLTEAPVAATAFIAREATSQKRPTVKARLITEVPKIGIPRQVLRAAWLLAPKDFRVFVDLFCGVTGSFLRVKPREIGEKEVLIDNNWDVIRVLKLVQSGEWRKLQRYRWYPISRRFIEEVQAELQDRMRRGDTSLRRTYLWLLALQFSDRGYPDVDKRLNFNKLNYKSWNKRAVERYFARFAEWEERLQGVVIRQMDAFKAMEHYDSKDTFFFADPPWNDPDDAQWYNTEFPFRDFLSAAASLKGRILILLDPGYLGVARELGLRYRRLVFEAWLYPGHDLDAELSEAVGKRRQRRLLYLLGNYDLPRLRKELIAQRSLPEEDESTHEEQRLEEERRLGDPFKVVHDIEDYPDGYPAVYMRHYRGLWSPEEADAVSELLDHLIRTRSAEERQDLWRTITKEFGAFALTEDFDRMVQEAQATSDKRGDVSKTIESFLTDDLEKALGSVRSASELRERLVNLASVHGDLRIVNPTAPKRQLIGWTVMTPAVAVQFTDGNIVPILRDKFLFYQPGDRLIVVKKARQPIVWLDVVNPDKPLLWAPPAAVGATAHRWALFEWHAFLRVWFGIQRPDYHEFFFQFDDLADDHYTLDDGKWVARYLPGKGEKIGKEGAYWQFWRPEKEGQLPYLLSHTASQAKREWKGRHYKYVITNSRVVPIVLDAFSDIAELAPEEDQVRGRLQEWDEAFPP